MSGDGFAFGPNPGHAPASLRAVFQRFGRIHIPAFLPSPTAHDVYETLRDRTPWNRTLNGSGGKTWDLPVAEFEALPPEQRNGLADAAYADARHGFQYLFDNYRLSNAVETGEAVDPVLLALYRFFNGPDFLGFVRALTGDPAAVYVDAQATRYLPGHFLTAHDDSAEDKHRLYAYVLNLTPRWRADWGGLLLFLDDDGHVAEGYTPAFNALNIFRVPQQHAVSLVAPFAETGRFSVTGWIRSQPERR